MVKSKFAVAELKDVKNISSKFQSCSLKALKTTARKVTAIQLSYIPLKLDARIRSLFTNPVT